jgi:hypothetical protein
MKPMVRVPHKWMVRSLAWAERSVRGYANCEKESSRAYARPGIDRSVDAQLLGKAGECAFCLFTGIDPERLDWGARCDNGWDVVEFNRRIDVKASGTEHLIWPVTKNSFLMSTPAELFTAVRRPNKLERDLYEMAGWVTVTHFRTNHHIAPPPEGFDRGTKHLANDELWEMESLRSSGLVHSLLANRRDDLLAAMFTPIGAAA